MKTPRRAIAVKRGGNRAPHDSLAGNGARSCAPLTLPPSSGAAFLPDERILIAWLAYRSD